MQEPTLLGRLSASAVFYNLLPFRCKIIYDFCRHFIEIIKPNCCKLAIWLNRLVTPEKPGYIVVTKWISEYCNAVISVVHELHTTIFQCSYPLLHWDNAKLMLLRRLPSIYGVKISYRQSMAAICFSTAVRMKELIETPACLARYATRVCISGVRRTLSDPE